LRKQKPLSESSIMNLSFIDSSTIRRGGQIYIERMIDSLSRSGHLCRMYLRSGEKSVKRSSFYYGLLRLMCEKETWVVGTAPSILPLALIARNPIILVQSPFQEWSLTSRIIYKLAMRRKNKIVICVSEFIRDSIGPKDVERPIVVYAQIRDSEEEDEGLKLTDCGRYKLSLALLNAREFEKGYLSTLVLISKVRESIEIEVDIYGEVKEELVELKSLCKVEMRGYAENPFKDFASRRRGWKKLYLGMSQFEGLHMAVVEAGQYGVPSILSDIEAHRELESLSSHSLMIGKTPNEFYSMVRLMMEGDTYYEQMVSAYKEMSASFVKESKTHIERMMQSIRFAEAEEAK